MRIFVFELLLAKGQVDLSAKVYPHQMYYCKWLTSKHHLIATITTV